MKKNKLFLIIIMSFSFVLLSFAKASNSHPHSTIFSQPFINADYKNEVLEISLGASLYNELQLQVLGLSVETVEYAINGYQKLQNEGKVSNRYLTLVDMSQSSRKKRFYILDMEQRKLVCNTYVSHGKNSGVDLANKFSNAINSEASSLGFYITSQTYTGKHGLSLRISGQEQGFNDNAEVRGIVVHGADYVSEGRARSAYMGRSQGCPALPVNEYAKVINTIKGGSVIFIYHPTNKYIQSSKFIRA